MKMTKAFIVWALCAFFWVGCGEESKPANELTNELYTSLRDSIIQEFEENELDSAFSDSLFSAVYAKFYEKEILRLQSEYDSLNGVYYSSAKQSTDSLNALNYENSKHNTDSLNALFATQSQHSQDSINAARDSQQALSLATAADSIKGSLYDSLYQEIYDEVYYDLYSAAASKNLSLTFRSSNPQVAPSQYSVLDTLYGDTSYQSCLVRVRVYNASTTESYKLKVQAGVDGYSATGSETVWVGPKDTVEVDMQPALVYSAFTKLASTVNGQVRYSVAVLKNDQESLVSEYTDAILVRPVNMLPSIYARSDGKPVPYEYSWAHWVQPQADSVLAVVTAASKLHASGSLAGYQDPGGSGDHTSITQSQVKAVYEALLNRGIVYVTSGGTGSGGGQIIQFPNQSLRRKYANCIDGTVLFAAVLERIGIDVAIVSIPGHTFLAYRTWENAATFEYVETTLAWSGGTFAQALSAGNAAYSAEVSAGNFTSGDSQVISIADARDMKIYAYPYDLEF